MDNFKESVFTDVTGELDIGIRSCYGCLQRPAQAQAKQNLSMELEDSNEILPLKLRGFGHLTASGIRS